MCCYISMTKGHTDEQKGTLAEGEVCPYGTLSFGPRVIPDYYFAKSAIIRGPRVKHSGTRTCGPLHKETSSTIVPRAT